jgi:hypothetical protein
MEVHPPHHAIGSWREFFVHMTTIVLGLLIAVGLEQSVEMLHRRHLRQELQENFRAEAGRNVKILTRHLDVNIPQLLWDRDALTAVRTAVAKAGYVDVTLPPAPIGPAGEGMVAPERNVWPVALSSTSLALLPEATAQMYARVDFEAGEDVKEVDRMREISALVAQFELATGYKIRPSTPLHLTLAQRDQLVTVLSMSAQQLYTLLRRDGIYMMQCEGVLKGFDNVESLMDWAAQQTYRMVQYRE